MLFEYFRNHPSQDKVRKYTAAYAIHFLKHEKEAILASLYLLASLLDASKYKNQHTLEVIARFLEFEIPETDFNHSELHNHWSLYVLKEFSESQKKWFAATAVGMLCNTEEFLAKKQLIEENACYFLNVSLHFFESAVENSPLFVGNTSAKVS